jgi:primosomal protein N' (replication factor Y) (superfamily II helicase)
MLFLNRRGFASSLICPKCGYVSECDQCSVSHTYHRSDDCCAATCAGHRAVPAAAPQCADPAFRFAGFGTQRVEDDPAQVLPAGARQRMDADTTTRKTPTTASWATSATARSTS